MSTNQTKHSQSKNLTMGELLASRYARGKLLTLSRGQQVEGEVVVVSDSEVILDLGTKSEGIILLKDFPANKKPKIGDRMEAFVIEPESESSQVILSLQSVQKAPRPSRFKNETSQQDFGKIAEKYIQDEIYTGTVTKISQFGVFVALEEGVEGLIHSSKVPANTTFEPGQKIQVSIDSIEIERRRIAFSPVITSTKDLIYK